MVDTWNAKIVMSLILAATRSQWSDQSGRVTWKKTLGGYEPHKQWSSECFCCRDIRIKIDEQAGSCRKQV